MNRSLLIGLLMALSLVGIADAVYLSLHVAAGTPLVCDIGAGLDGCNTVANSPYSLFLGIPLAYYGLVFYAVFFALSLLASFFPPRKRLYGALALLSLLSAASSVGFLYVQFALIKAVCIYCVLSAVLTFCSLPVAVLLFRRFSPQPPALAA